jgi:hypothetical protein
MWPPSSEDSLLARRIIAIAFQRISERTRRSIDGSPGSSGSSSTGIVFTYGVGPTYSIAAPRWRARSTTRSTRS